MSAIGRALGWLCAGMAGLFAARFAYDLMHGGFSSVLIDGAIFGWNAFSAAAALLAKARGEQ